MYIYIYMHVIALLFMNIHVGTYRYLGLVCHKIQPTQLFVFEHKLLCVYTYISIIICVYMNLIQVYIYFMMKYIYIYIYTCIRMHLYNFVFSSAKMLIYIHNKSLWRIFEAVAISFFNSLNTCPGFYNISLYLSKSILNIQYIPSLVNIFHIYNNFYASIFLLVFLSFSFSSLWL